LKILDITEQRRNAAAIVRKENKIPPVEPEGSKVLLKRKRLKEMSFGILSGVE